MQNYDSIKIRKAVLLFMRGLSAPLVLYFEEPEKKFVEIQDVIKNQIKGQILEFQTSGPLKHVAVLSSEITGVAIQDEPYKQ